MPVPTSLGRVTGLIFRIYQFKLYSIEYMSKRICKSLRSVFMYVICSAQLLWNLGYKCIMIYGVVSALQRVFQHLYILWLLEFPDLKRATQQASFKLTTNLLPQPPHIDFPSLLADDIKYCKLRVSDKADDPTQMKWGWYEVGQHKWPQGTPPCIPHWVWILVNADERAAPEPPPSCCRRTWLLQASMIDEWDALETAGHTFFSIALFNKERHFCLGTFSTA